MTAQGSVQPFDPVYGFARDTSWDWLDAERVPTTNAIALPRLQDWSQINWDVRGREVFVVARADDVETVEVFANHVISLDSRDVIAQCGEEFFGFDGWPQPPAVMPEPF